MDYFIIALDKIPVSVYSSLAGVVLGFFLNSFKERYDNRIILFYSIQGEKLYDEWSYDSALETDPSGMALTIYNYGRNPIMIKSLSIKFKKNFIDGIIHDSIIILPYHKKTCSISKQDYEVMLDWVKEDVNEKFIITAYTANNKKINQKLDATIIKFTSDKFNEILSCEGLMEKVIFKIKSFIYRLKDL